MPMSVFPDQNASAGGAMDSSPLLGLVNQWPMFATAILTCVAAFLTQTAFKSDGWSGIPMIGTEYGGQSARRNKFMQGESKNLYLNGYKKFKDMAFQITTANKKPNIVIAPKFMNELKGLPDDVLSFDKAIEESMQTQYTGIDSDEQLPHIVKTSLTPALGRLNHIVADEVADALLSELPQSGNWTSVKMMEKVMRIVAIASGRIFVGPELCRNEKYLDISINYTLHVMEAVRAVSEIFPGFRFFLAGRTTEVKRVRQCLNEADDFLRPVVKARREAENNIDYRKPDDMLQWIMDAQSKFGQEKTDKEIALFQLSTSFAAIHTTTITATNALYTLASMPDVMKMLREEVQSVLVESDGAFTSTALQNMKKLDSFLKEDERYYALGSTSFQRKVLKTFTLSNGQVIPAGAIIELPVIGINTDEEFFPDHDRFDALRFYKLRQEKTNAEKGTKQAEVVANAQFVSTGPSSLTFGYGRHACPGRFFAANEIKMILALLLIKYDMKIIGTERYPNLEYGEMISPDPEREILVKRL